MNNNDLSPDFPIYLFLSSTFRMTSLLLNRDVLLLPFTSPSLAFVGYRLEDPKYTVRTKFETRRSGHSSAQRFENVLSYLSIL